MPNQLVVKIKLVHPKAITPVKANATDSGWDIFAVSVTQKRHNIFFVDSGLQIEAPPGYYIEIYPRSSIYKIDFIQTNSVGIIDNGYRGNIMIPLRYVGEEDGHIQAEKLIDQRIAQMIIRKNIDASLQVVTGLQGSQRGSLGFGSSGKH